MADVTVYIDGFNLYYGALKARPTDRWLDIASLSRALVPSDTVLRIRYFTARVKGHPDDPKVPERQNVYLRAITADPLTKVHYGRYTQYASGVLSPKITTRSTICSGRP